ncbi:sulfotransferase [uncultured Demequina sp.]|uniref:sulfotransferase n=1 Tax=uncultured Demequina sp. TaxID=693499 RepID=UPI0025F4B527|nr:sulfotransferase [uncultured Demequina sp.]
MFGTKRRSPSPTFLLGLGAQKAGTTWLHAYLDRSPQFDGGYFKEYHVLDAIDLDYPSAARRAFDGAIAAAERGLRGEEIGPRHLHRAAMIADTRVYYDYFSTLAHADPEVRLTADYTPIYALLPQRRLEEVRAEVSRRGMRPAAMFLMRDPVERIYSQIRMRARDVPENLGADAETMLLKWHRKEIYASRSRYEDTIRRIDATFPEEDAYFGFYEELFTRDTVQDICRFLGIDMIEPDFAERKNVSSPRSDDGPDAATLRKVARSLRPTYEFVAERFPDRDIRALWPNAHYVL